MTKDRKDRKYSKSIAISEENKNYIRSLRKTAQYKSYGDAGVLNDIINQHKGRQGKLI